MIAAAQATTDARLDTWYCPRHGFIAPGEANHYCLRCLQAWGPVHLPKVRMGPRPVEV